MRTATVTLKSVSPYSQSRHHTTPRRENEPHAEYEKRTWRERMHVTESGEVFIPPMAFKNCLSEAAKFLSLSVPGKGKATYTKHFEAGVMIIQPMALGIKAAEVRGEDLFLPADGKRGSGKRVDKTYPLIPSWQGTIEVMVLDNTITNEAFEKHLDAAGKYIGIGRFRPRNNGFYGRFEVLKVEWSKTI